MENKEVYKGFEDLFAELNCCLAVVDHMLETSEMAHSSLLIIHRRLGLSRERLLSAMSILGVHLNLRDNNYYCEMPEDESGSLVFELTSLRTKIEKLLSLKGVGFSATTVLADLYYECCQILVEVKRANAQWIVRRVS